MLLHSNVGDSDGGPPLLQKISCQSCPYKVQAYNAPGWMLNRSRYSNVWNNNF